MSGVAVWVLSEWSMSNRGVTMNKVYIKKVIQAWEQRQRSKISSLENAAYKSANSNLMIKGLIRRIDELQREKDASYKFEFKRQRRKEFAKERIKTRQELAVVVRQLLFQTETAVTKADQLELVKRLQKLGVNA